ncbi:TPA: helix-turn-helix domain-containing protein [Vibrio harveyi]|nr:helix-turn-helix domain-containing protein [Vibrio harveyi]HEQ3599250.1 helix-turn-helix domain-containing protein [Vibrio harveyi]HEQ3611308.1 helix-turn-helix domain-containing protein [Vibrio harveyi]
MAKVNQKQIADLVGVHQSTVSKVLRGQIPRNMSQEKIDQIKKVADELGYKRPEPKAKEKPTQPAQPAKPRKPAQPKFGATPQGDPIHKYGAQWRQAMAADTGIMPKGNFSSLKLGEQRQVMRVLNSIDKDGKKRTEISNKNYKANVANKVWEGLAFSAGAVGIPLSVSGLISQFIDLAESSADTARFAKTIDIDPDKMLGMVRQASIFGVDEGEFKSGLSSLQSLSTQMRKGENQKLLEPFASLGLGAPGLIGKVQDRGLAGDTMGILKAINESYQAGDINKNELSELMNRLGASAFTNLMVGGDFGKVALAKPLQGAGEAAIELSEKLGILKANFEKLFIDNFDEINTGMDSFIGWLKNVDFNSLISLFSALGVAVEKVLNLAGIETRSSLESKLISFRTSLAASRPGSIAANTYREKIAEVESELSKTYGVTDFSNIKTAPPTTTPTALSMGARTNNEEAIATVSQSRNSTVDKNFNISLNISSDNQLTDEQIASLKESLVETVNEIFRDEKNKIDEEM